MKLTFGNESIDFFDFDYSNLKIGIALSGGADSALLLYLAAKYLKDVEIIPWSGYEVTEDPLHSRPFTILDCIDIVHFVKDKFPNSNIVNHHIWAYDRTAKGINKKYFMRDEYRRSLDSGIIDLYVTAKSKNPPLEIIHTFLDVSQGPVEEERNHKGIEKPNSTYYAPFINIDKSSIAKLYKKYNLLKDLFPLTNSCVGFADTTNWFTEPCKRCFWCHERKWAFGYYDGEI